MARFPVLQILEGATDTVPGRIERVRGLLGEPASDEEIRAVLTAVGHVVSRRDLVGREIWRQTYRERQERPSEAQLYPSRWPIESVLAIYEGPDPEDATEIPFEIAGTRRSSLYRSEGWGGIRGVSARPYPWGLAGDDLERDGDALTDVLTLDYTAGYAMPGEDLSALPGALPLPEDLLLAFELTAAEYLRGGLELPLGIASEADPTGKTVYVMNAEKLPPVPPAAAAIFKSHGAPYQ